MPDKKTLLGFAIGVGCTVVTPLVVSVCASSMRPLAKSILKQSLLTTNLLLEKLAVAAESVSDLIAEVRSEVDEELLRKGPPRRERADGEAEANGSAETARQGAH